MIFTLANVHFIVWPSSVTLTFVLPEQVFQTFGWLVVLGLTALWDSISVCIGPLFQTKAVQIILKTMYKCRSYDPDKLNLDYFITWPSRVTLTQSFNLPKQMLQMALLLLKENNCAKLFWNPCINVQVMARTISIYNHLIIWPSGVTLTFNLPE